MECARFPVEANAVGQQGTRRGFTVRRETLVRRLPESDPRE